MLSSLPKHKKEKVDSDFEKKSCVNSPATSWSECTETYKVLGQREEINTCGKKATEILI